MRDPFDDFLFEEFKKYKEPIPSEDHFQKLNDVLNNLSTRKSKRIYYKAAIIIFACLFFSSTGVYAGVNSCIMRFDSISKKQIAEMNLFMKRSNANADSYSRKLSADEEYRLTDTIIRYENGQFPRKELLQVEKISDVKENSFCYCFENSTFYLPKEALTDEQMLEIVDFQQMRDYVLSNASKSEVIPRPERDVDNTFRKEESKSVQEIATEFIEDVLGKDVSDAEITVKKRRKNETYSTGENYGVIVKTSSDCYEVVVRDKNGTSNIIGFEDRNNDLKIVKDAVVNEQDIMRYVENAMHAYKYFENQREPVKAEVTYCADDETLIEGRLYILLYKDVISGYLLEYDQNEKSLLSINFIDDMSDFHEALDRRNEYYKQQNKKYKVIRKVLHI